MYYRGGDHNNNNNNNNMLAYKAPVCQKTSLKDRLELRTAVRAKVRDRGLGLRPGCSPAQFVTIAPLRLHAAILSEPYLYI